jgi:hypothetical protein
MDPAERGGVKGGVLPGRWVGIPLAVRLTAIQVSLCLAAWYDE